jgi:hypothetical protein
LPDLQVLRSNLRGLGVADSQIAEVVVE